MKKERSRRFKDYKAIQKTGVILMLIGAAIIVTKFVGLLSAGHFVMENLPNYLLLAGALLMLLPSISDRLRGSKAKTIAIITVAISASMNGFAQDYTTQVNAFKESFEKKSVEPITPYVGAELKFDPIPIANTPAILTNIVSNLPTLNSMVILETEQGKVKIKYDFESLGMRESYIHFDSEGKFERIELIENLIQQELKAQRRLQQSVQQPPVTDLAKKYTPKLIEIESKDGLIVSGNLYEIGTGKPVILLGHQAGYNKMEYIDIAPKLNKLGFNCLAVDLRSGGTFAEEPNQTAERAVKEGFENEMIDAQQDMQATIDYLYDKYDTKIILWGSSYSSSLALLEGVANDKVRAIIAFSPGDYFGSAAPSLSTVFAKAKKPFLVTSSKEEAPTLRALIGMTDLESNQSQFIPEMDGFHGSRALWTGQKGAEEYWNAVITFLNSL